MRRFKFITNLIGKLNLDNQNKQLSLNKSINQIKMKQNKKFKELAAFLGVEDDSLSVKIRELYLEISFSQPEDYGYLSDLLEDEIAMYNLSEEIITSFDITPSSVMIENVSLLLENCKLKQK